MTATRVLARVAAGSADPGVIYIGNYLSHVGVSRQPCEELVPRLQARGWSVITASRVRNRLGRVVDMAWKLCTHGREYRVAVIDVFSGPSFRWAEITNAIAHWLGKRVVLVLHGGQLPVFAERHPARVRRLFVSAERVLAPSRFLKDSLRKYHPDIDIIPNGIDLPSHRTNDTDERSIGLVWLRAFRLMYNPVLAVEVLALLKEEFPCITLLMVGPDTGDGSLEQTKLRAKDLGVIDSVTFFGPIPKSEVPSVLKRGRVFLNTTNIDNAPVSVLEAMASGLCIVSTSVGGLPYLLEDGATALLTPRGDASAMANAAARVLRDERLARKLITEATHVVARCDWEQVLDSWESIFRASPKFDALASRMKREQ
jgi:glycosyltransferase involved in cell wall biosynthesis